MLIACCFDGQVPNMDMSLNIAVICHFNSEALSNPILSSLLAEGYGLKLAHLFDIGQVMTR